MPACATTSTDSVDPALQLIRLGTIASVDLVAAKCTVRIGDQDNGGFTTTPIQWLAQRAGETSHWSPPSIGEQVLVLCPDGDIAQAIALPGLYSNQFPAPGNSARELVRYGDGAEFAYDPERHHADIILPEGGTLSVKSTGGVQITGKTKIDGTLTVSSATDIQANLKVGGSASISGDVDAGGDVTASGVSLKKHVHKDVRSGSEKSGRPE